MFNNDLNVKELHYAKSMQTDEMFIATPGSPWFGATNATIYYDL